jgi:hypothetical protein
MVTSGRMILSVLELPKASQEIERPGPSNERAAQAS